MLASCVKIAMLAALSLLIVILGMPNVEQSRTEARNTMAYNLARQIKAGTVPVTTRDPWGNAFDIRQSNSDIENVTSRGANMVTPPDAYDSDDISTSMTNPPHLRSRARKHDQMFYTLAIAAIPWLLFFAFLIRRRFSRSPVLNM